MPDNYEFEELIITFSPDFLTTFRFLDKNEDAGKDNKSIIYGGDDTFMHKGFKIVSWDDQYCTGLTSLPGF